jgi:protein TIF31
LQSSLADDLFEQGSQQIGQGNIAIGEGLVSDAINYYEQIFGSVHPELANRYHELAVSYHQLSQPLIRNISAYETSKEAGTTEARTKAKADTTIESDEMLEAAKRELRGFVESAVQMNRQSIIVAERTLGIDHHTTAQQYVDLAILEHANGNVQLGLKLCRHAIELLEQIYGPNHPEAIRAIVSCRRKPFHQS